MCLVFLTIAVGSKVTYCAVCFRPETMLKTGGAGRWDEHSAKKLKSQLSDHREQTRT